MASDNNLGTELVAKSLLNVITPKQDVEKYKKIPREKSEVEIRVTILRGNFYHFRSAIFYHLIP